MSLATLARKTRAKQRLGTRGKFILNMTGRGNVLGMNAKMSRGNCPGFTKCAGKRAACCNHGAAPEPPYGPCLDPLDNQDNNFTVGEALGTSTFYGYAGSTGNLIPLNLKAHDLKWLGWQKNGSFPSTGTFFVSTVNGTTTTLPSTYFTSITFVDCTDNSIRTYNTVDATYSSTGGSSGSSNSPTWEWGFGSPYTDDEAYWSSKNGRTLKVYIDTIPDVGDICCPRAQCCQFKHGGKPAPQMGYGVYLNRKSKGAYHSGGGPQCCTKPNAKTKKIVWKQQSNLDASVVITNKKDNVLACNSDVYTAKKDTCTGCVCKNDPTTNTTVVGQGSGHTAELKTGYNGPPGTTFGSYTPDNIVTSIGTLHLEMAEFSALVPPAPPGTPSFSDLFVIYSDPSDNSGARFTVAFVDCEDGTHQIFNTADAIYKDNTTMGLGGAAANQYTAFIWGNTATYGGTAVGITGIATAQAYAVDSGGTYVPWDSMQAWWEARNGKTLKVLAVPNEGGISQEMIGEILNCCWNCCCPVNKNICGCRATDLVRYTRINKSFGCQATKAVRMGRSASEQIARSRAVVDCIKPMYRDIFITLDRSGITSMNFTGCCGNQCIISGQQYNFYINIIAPTIGMPNNFRIRWCGDLVSTLGSLISTNDIQIAGVFSVTVPNTSCDGLPPASLGWWIGNDFTDHAVTLDYCKQAFKKPQMLGSCSGR